MSSGTRNRVGRNKSALSQHRTCRSAYGVSTQTIIVQATQKSSPSEDFFVYEAQSCGLGYRLVVVSKCHRLFRHPLRCSEFTQSPISLTAFLPLFPYDDSHAVTQMLVDLGEDCFHTSDSEIVYPPPNDFVEHGDSVIHAHRPSSSCQLLQSAFKSCD